jgi:hypothetical protein
MMMDDERNRRTFNQARQACLCRGGTNCGIPIPDTTLYPPHHKTPVMIQRTCLPDEPYSCPLWVFVKAITKQEY